MKEAMIKREEHSHHICHVASLSPVPELGTFKDAKTRLHARSEWRSADSAWFQRSAAMSARRNEDSQTSGLLGSISNTVTESRLTIEQLC
jgi:hypothetical protein